jgi:Na+/phosphate symporter
MNFKSLQRSRDARDASAGTIVFLMMGLVFVPIMAIHAAMIWQDQLTAAPQQLASIVNLALSIF